MKSTRLTILSLVMAILSLVACSGEQGPTGTAPAVQELAVNLNNALVTQKFPETLINNFSVRFDGRTVDAAGTTFSYTVRGTGVQPDLTHFTIEIPECTVDPVAFSSTNSVSINYDPNTEIYGIDWHLSVQSGDVTGRQYSVTFPGVVPLGEVKSAVVSGSSFGVGAIPGPCAGYDISGSVFADANQNGLLDLDESGISNVVVELIGAASNLQTTTTDSTGAYVFRKATGDYTVRIITDGTIYPGFFNGQLAESFDPTTSLTAEVTVPPNSPGHDFGFNPKTQKLIFDLESGTLLSNGESVKYWKKTLQGALNNSHRPGGYLPETVVDFVTKVREFFIENPYDFADGFEGVQQAFDILKSHPKEDVDLLLQQLLATELNEVSGQGLIEPSGLQPALISWGESVVFEAWAAAQPANGDAIIPFASREAALGDAIRLFELMNTGGGGSVDE